MLKNYRKNYKGFTLLELLVVVLIIGILAAIVLPQYRLAVGKSKYATLKSITKSLKESYNRYFLINNSLPTKFSDLDIDLNIIRENTTGTGNNLTLWIWGSDFRCELNDGKNIICYKNIAGKNMRYHDYTSKRLCDVYSVNVNDIPNRICQAETGKSAGQAICSSGDRCVYQY